MAAFMTRQGFTPEFGTDTEASVVRHVRTLAAAGPSAAAPRPEAADRALPAAWEAGWRRLRAWRPPALRRPCKR